MKLSKLFTACILCAVLILNATSCGSDDKEDIDYSNIMAFKNKGVIESSAGITETIELDVYDNYNYGRSQLYIGDKEINVVHGSSESGRYINISITEDMVGYENVPVTFRLNGQIIAEGVSLTVRSAYKYFYFGVKTLRPGENHTLVADGEYVRTFYRPFVGDGAKDIGIKFKNLNGSDDPSIESVYSAEYNYPIPAEGFKPLYTITEVKVGYAYRSGTAYSSCRYGYLSERLHYIVKHQNGTASFVGYGNYIQSFTNTVSEIVVDSNDNLYIIETGKEKQIYKMSETSAATLWKEMPNDIVRMQMDAKNNLYVADKTSISKITPDGAVTKLSVTFSDIKSIALAADGKIYVIDGEQSKTIKVVNAEHTSVASYRIKDGYIPAQETTAPSLNNMAVTTDGVIYLSAYIQGTKACELLMMVPDNLK